MPVNGLHHPYPSIARCSHAVAFYWNDSQILNALLAWILLQGSAPCIPSFSLLSPQFFSHIGRCRMTCCAHLSASMPMTAMWSFLYAFCSFLLGRSDGSLLSFFFGKEAAYRRPYLLVLSSVQSFYLFDTAYYFFRSFIQRTLIQIPERALCRNEVMLGFLRNCPLAPL